MGWKLCLMFLLTTAVVSDVRGQSLAELAKMAGIDLKDISGDAFDKQVAEATTPASGLRGLLGRAGLIGSSSSSSTTSNSPAMKSASTSSSAPAAGTSASPCGNCGNCPSCLMRQMKLMSSDFGGYPSGSDSGYPGMIGQLGPMGMGSDVETMNAMNSPFASDMGGLPGRFSGFGAGPSNFMPADSYAPFVGAPSMLAGAGGFEQYPESGQRYPLHEEEMPRTFPTSGRTRFHEPAAQPVYEPEQQPGGGEEGVSEEQGPPQYDQGQQEQEAPQGYAGSQEAGPDDQQSGYARQPESEQGYAEGPETQQRGGTYQRSDYALSQSYYDK